MTKGQQAAVSAYLKEIGRLGGLKKSANKTAAARLNAKRPRPNRKKAA